jgi:hypothetical protein
MSREPTGLGKHPSMTIWLVLELDPLAGRVSFSARSCMLA